MPTQSKSKSSKRTDTRVSSTSKAMGPLESSSDHESVGVVAFVKETGAPWPEGEAVTLPIGGGNSQQQRAWRLTPQREFLRCLAAALYKERNLRGTVLFRAFRDLVPNYERHLHKVTATSIAGKGYNCWYYKKENPDKDPNAQPYYELAKQVVSRSRSVDVDEVLKHLGSALPQPDAHLVDAAEHDLAEVQLGVDDESLGDVAVAGPIVPGQEPADAGETSAGQEGVA